MHREVYVYVRIRVSNHGNVGDNTNWFEQKKLQRIGLDTYVLSTMVLACK